MKITEEHKEWIINAYDKGFTRLQIYKKLRENKTEKKLMEEMLKYHDSLKEEVEKLTEKEKENKKDEEKEFKKNVKDYIKDPSTLNKKEKKEVKKWLKNMEKLIKILESTTKSIEMEIKEIKEKFKKNSKEMEKELEELRLEVIERIWDTSDSFYIEHPKTKKTIESKEELMDISLEEAIELIEINNEELRLEVHGKE